MHGEDRCEACMTIYIYIYIYIHGDIKPCMQRTAVRSVWQVTHTHACIHVHMYINMHDKRRKAAKRGVAAAEEYRDECMTRFKWEKDPEGMRKEEEEMKKVLLRQTVEVSCVYLCICVCVCVCISRPWGHAQRGWRKQTVVVSSCVLICLSMCMCIYVEALRACAKRRRKWRKCFSDRLSR
jgi:hypothetical protein